VDVQDDSAIRAPGDPGPDQAHERRKTARERRHQFSPGQRVSLGPRWSGLGSRPSNILASLQEFATKLLRELGNLFWRGIARLNSNVDSRLSQLSSPLGLTPLLAAPISLPSTATNSQAVSGGATRA
jgi:hypothetical protein